MEKYLLDPEDPEDPEKNENIFSGTEEIELGLAVMISGANSTDTVRTDHNHVLGVKTARSLGEVAHTVGAGNEGFGAFFSITYPPHEEQHQAFCEHLEIEEGNDHREFLVATWAGIVVLERMPVATDEDGVHGLRYDLFVLQEVEIQ